MKEVWNMRASANIIDGHKDYLQDMSRIASPQFRPTQQDILLSRVKTTQVVMERYRIDNIDFEMFDVGGQRAERRKWIDYFDNVDAVIFVAALSEYDQSLAEAKRTNRMSEALELFRSVCNNRAFSNTGTSIMLFLNKKDVFAEKIIYSDIAAQKPFSDYAGPTKDFNSGVMYFIQKFKDCLIDDNFNDSFIHVTCATDTNNMEFVLDATRSIIMTENLRRSGFLGAG
jgi:GTPase SAR1 family protein